MSVTEERTYRRKYDSTTVLAYTGRCGTKIAATEGRVSAVIGLCKALCTLP